MTKKQQKCNEQTGHYWESQEGEENRYRNFVIASEDAEKLLKKT